MVKTMEEGQYHWAQSLGIFKTDAIEKIRFREYQQRAFVLKIMMQAQQMLGTADSVCHTT